MRKIISLGLCTLVTGASQANTPLPRLNIDPQSITISGLSSGAFMSVQMLVAWSSTIKGAAVFAGGPYNCSEGQLVKAVSTCMNNPDRIKVDQLVEEIKKSEVDGQIDSTKNLSQAKLYIFSSAADSVVKEKASEKLKEQLSRWIPATSIRTLSQPGVAHGIPTLDFGNECAKFGSPFLQKCATDGVGQSLLFLYGPTLNSPRELTSLEKQAVKPFDQRQGIEAAAQLADQGFIFVPPQCSAGGKACRLHLALHGCDQNAASVGQVFIENAGYLRWAVDNNMVVLFPQVSPSRQNPKGCWDWFAYTGSDFAKKTGPQMKALRSFIQQVSGF